MSGLTLSAAKNLDFNVSGNLWRIDSETIAKEQRSLLKVL